MKKEMNFLLLIAAFLVSVFAANADAALVTWTDWTSATPGASGSASGTMGGVTVSFSGQLEFAQLGISDPNPDYWLERNPKPYTGNSVVSNAPTPKEMLALDTAAARTLTFSQSVANPILAIVSLGGAAAVSYDFDKPFTVLSEGNGYWGDGTYTLEAGDVLVGQELHGVIQFKGSLDSISWPSSPGEYWHGITVGVVPIPAAAWLLGTGLIGLVVIRQRKFWK